jgi:NTE family protein
LDGRTALSARFCPVRAGASALGLLLLLLAGGAAPPGRPRIGLALSGGGARGIAHVAVLEVLEEQRVPIDCIAGTSMGAIVGGMYASGLSPAEIRTALLGLDWTDLVTDRPQRRDLGYRRKEDDASDLINLEMGVRAGRLLLPRGLVTGQKIAIALESLTLPAALVRDFDRLPIPFRAVATDLGTGEMVVLKSGKLADALHASMSIPGILAPFEMDGHLLADGGLVRNLPVDVVRSMGADVVIAVDVSTPLFSREELRSLADITLQVTGIMTRENVEEQIKQADVVIIPELGAITATDYTRAESILASGAAAARAQKEALARYALADDTFTGQLARARAPLAPLPPIDALVVEGYTRVDRRIIENRLKTRAGGPLDVHVLESDLERVYGLGDFERVDYCLEPEGDQTKLVIRTTEKSWGPNYLRFGLNMRNDFQGDTDFNIISRLTMTRIDPLGAEWRSDVEVGETRRVSSEFYQPLDFSGTFFVAPSVDYANAIVGVFEGDDRIAEYQTRSISGSLALGAQLGRYGEARVGLIRGRVWARPRVGDPGLPVLDVPVAAYAARFVVDRFDNPSFPHRGRGARLDVYMPRRGLGSDVSYDRVQGSIVQVFGAGRHHVFMGLEGGTNLGSPIPFYDEFPVGGLFSLSGFKQGQLRGQLFGAARSGYYRRSGKLSGISGQAIYLGGWLEAGNAWATSRDVRVGDLHYAATLVIGADTFLGPIFLAYGHADGGHDAFYLSMGRSLGGNRRFGFGHF